MIVDSIDDASDISRKVSLVCLLGLALIFLLVLPNRYRRDQPHRASDVAGYTDGPRYGFVFLPCRKGLFGVIFDDTGLRGKPGTGSV